MNGYLKDPYPKRVVWYNGRRYLDLKHRDGHHSIGIANQFRPVVWIESP